MAATFFRSIGRTCSTSSPARFPKASCSSTNVSLISSRTTKAVKVESGESIRADALIGADGIHSAIREKLWGKETVHFDAKLMWRALVPADRIRSIGFEKRCHIWSGPGRSVVCYWVRPDNLFNFVGTVPSNEVHRESYTTSGDVEDLRRSFRGAEPRVTHLVDSVSEAFITGLYYRDPKDAWARGRVTLLGDAAHAMAPFLAQGACASIEDAWILAKCIAKQKNDLPAAFLEYEQRRKPRTARVQAAARAMVKQLHETDAKVIRARNGRLIGMSRIDPLSETVWGWLYDYNPLKAVEEPADKVLGLASAFEGKKMKRANCSAPSTCGNPLSARKTWHAESTACARPMNGS